MSTRKNVSFFVLGLAVMVTSVARVWAEDNSADHQWQLQMLFHPSGEQLQMESRGRVFIYDGVTSADIDQAMDRNYERIENMMFVNTVWTNANGEPLRNSVTGEPMADDDC